MPLVCAMPVIVGRFAAASMAIANSALLASAATTECGAHVALLVLHTAILEPNFHLLLRQLQLIRNFDSTQTRQILAERKLTLQIQQLFAGERRANSLA